MGIPPPIFLSISELPVEMTLDLGSAVAMSAKESTCLASVRRQLPAAGRRAEVSSWRVLLSGYRDADPAESKSLPILLSDGTHMSRMAGWVNSAGSHKALGNTPSRPLEWQQWSVAVKPRDGRTYWSPEGYGPYSTCTWISSIDMPPAMPSGRSSSETSRVFGPLRGRTLTSSNSSHWAT